VVDESVTVLVPSYRHFVESTDKPLVSSFLSKAFVNIFWVVVPLTAQMIDTIYTRDMSW
jgi:hypothetical protein